MENRFLLVALIVMAVAAGVLLLVAVLLLRPRKNTLAAGQGTSTAVAGQTPGAQAPASGTLSSEEIFAKLHKLALGGSREPKLPPAHQSIANATAVALRDGATDQRYAPRRPNMLPRLLSAANDENVSRRELTSIIARDPSLVGSLLRIANSSFYRVTPEPVESVDRAVALLGTDGIRSLITAAIMQPIFRFGGLSFPRFPEISWEHTFRAANAAVPHAFLVEKIDPFTTELLSLVMGLAGIVVFRIAMDQYTAEPSLRPDAGVMASLLDLHTADAARRIGASWELSEATLSALDGQCWSAMTHPTPMGRSLLYGRLVGALAVLRINNVVDEAIAKASLPATSMPPTQLERMWSRLVPEQQHQTMPRRSSRE